MSAQHTPGPWQNQASGYFARAFTRYIASEDMEKNDKWCIATIHGPDCEANARLIAAAPELLAALQRAANHLIMSGTRQTDAAEALDQARAAIARATSV